MKIIDISMHLIMILTCILALIFTTFNSWILDENTCIWEAPIPYPTDGKKYEWNEETLTWIEIPNNQI